MTIKNPIKKLKSCTLNNRKELSSFKFHPTIYSIGVRGASLGRHVVLERPVDLVAVVHGKLVGVQETGEAEEQQEEEAHYYSVLTDMAELMATHGSKQVMMDLLEVSIQLDLVSKSIN